MVGCAVTVCCVHNIELMWKNCKCISKWWINISGWIFIQKYLPLNLHKKVQKKSTFSELWTKYNGKTSWTKWEIRRVILEVFIYFVHPRHSHRAQGVILPILRVNRASPLSIVYAACQNVWITKGKQKIQEFSKLSVYILFCSKREKPNFFQIPKV